MSTELVMSSNHLVLRCPLLLNIRVFSNESGLRIWWLKYWSFSFSISPSSEYPGLISFRMDWFDLLAVQGTLMSLLQHHNLKASILWHSTFFTIQLSHLYMTTVLNGNPLQYSCLENPTDGGVWWATVHGSQRVRHNWATSLFTSLYYKHENVWLLAWKY